MDKIIKNNPFFESVWSILESRQNVTVTVKGYSMGPFLRSERDSVTIAPLSALGRGVKKGDILFFINRTERGESYVMHRVIAVKDGVYTLRGDNNPLKMKEYCRLKDVKGVVVSCNRDGRVYLPKSLKWQLYRYAIYVYRLLR